MVNQSEAEEIEDELIESVPEIRTQIESELTKTIVGQKSIINQLLITLLCDSHAIIVGVPGLAKTRMVHSLSRVLDLDFNRIQFTPDLMPSDVTGTDILRETSEGRQFEFRKGPIFTDILLADEINRTPPKTQSALLQAMQEREITAGGTTYQLSAPFFVLATQNPIEQEGTYPLPEAQLDRFMLHINVDYPDSDEEEEIVKMTTGLEPEELQPILEREKILELQRAVRLVPADEALVEETVKLVQMTRPETDRAPEFVNNLVRWGAGPRASQFLILAGKARALITGKSHVEREDIRELMKPILRHRIIRSFTAESENIETEQILEKLLAEWG